MLIHLKAAAGWRQWALFFVLGGVAALGHPPSGIVIAPLTAIPLFMYLLSQKGDQSWPQHFKMGWWFGLGYFTTGLYWISFALGVDIASFWWLVPFALFGIPSVLSIYMGILAIVLRKSKLTGVSYCAAFALLWSLMELAMASGPLAFPWNPIGLIWSGFDPLMQMAAYVGIQGLSVVTILFLTFPFLFIDQKLQPSGKYFIAGLILVLMIAGAVGAMRPGRVAVDPDTSVTKVRIVQPKIPQLARWDNETLRQTFFELLRLSAEDRGPKPDIIVWPESSLPLFLDENKDVHFHLADMLGEGQILVAGTTRREIKQGQRSQFWNSLVVFNSEGKVIESYDKSHLVPFGEYVPFRSIIPSILTKITAGDIDYTQGLGLETIDVEGLPSFSPLICFEAIFTGAVVAKQGPRPKWLLNITNDAWYGNSSGPYQHLQMTRLRAIEEGIPLVRVANTGISAAFDAFGRELARIPLNQKDILDIELPPRLMHTTFFSQNGTLIYVLLLLHVISLLFIRRKS